jgi:hypothetical protein
VRDHGKFDSPNHDLGHPRIDHVLEIEPEILETIEEEPNLSIRRLALRVGVFTFIVYRTLHEQGLLHLYHAQRVQVLQNADPFRRIAFCQWRGRKIYEVPNFRLLTTDEIEIV